MKKIIYLSFGLIFFIPLFTHAATCYDTQTGGTGNCGPNAWPINALVSTGKTPNSPLTSTTSPLLYGLNVVGPNVSVFYSGIKVGGLQVASGAASTFGGSLIVNGSATSTFSGGINITGGGCIAKNGKCITSPGANGSASGSSGEVQFADSGVFGSTSNFYWDIAKKFLTIDSSDQITESLIRGPHEGPSDASISESDGNGSYRPGDRVQYRVYAEFDTGSFIYYSTTYAETNAITLTKVYPQVNITWTPVDGATSYVIFRKLNGGDFTEALNTNSKNAEFYDSASDWGPLIDVSEKEGGLFHRFGYKTGNDIYGAYSQGKGYFKGGLGVGTLPTHALDVSGEVKINNSTRNSTALKVYGTGDGGYLTKGQIEWFNSNTGLKAGSFSDDGEGNYGLFSLNGNGIKSDRLAEWDIADISLDGDRRVGSMIVEKSANGGDAYSFNFITRKGGNFSNATLYIDGNDKVGVGTDKPQHKLDVAGGVHSSGMIIADKGIKSPYSLLVAGTRDSVRESIQADISNIDSETVAMFWNTETRKIEVYSILEDQFYDMNGEVLQ